MTRAIEGEIFTATTRPGQGRRGEPSGWGRRGRITPRASLMLRGIEARPERQLHTCGEGETERDGGRGRCGRSGVFNAKINQGRGREPSGMGFHAIGDDVGVPTSRLGRLRRREGLKARPSVIDPVSDQGRGLCCPGRI
eukprot:CAMPEP_0172574236 /NCGR_PEP_ID=MMETSP1067-20121228/136602_1 /TAXON_ID=265564 ORGANISM="Thalassiosira punctigera, Strain Tpunct2005C2" /NCGR_SAMPLE_ID=MMETSP1067 /ASSEMBLY_ACC=CAM_ASM_000444 /LENGTH=138 /DNA_ID=CAMNT_0013366861 /DNA_START=139 /DNA_END=556 /DNA_ORIENTATION=-